MKLGGISLIILIPIEVCAYDAPMHSGYHRIVWTALIYSTTLKKMYVSYSKNIYINSIMDCCFRKKINFICIANVEIKELDCPFS